MGSWNTTCAVSATPIVSGNKVRLFFLASDRNGYAVDLKRDSLSNRYLSYPYSDFKILGGVGLKATYDDYGRYELDEKSIEAQHVLNTIKENYSINPKSKNKEDQERKFESKHIELPVEKLNFKKIQEMIHEGDLYLKSLMSNQVLNFVTVMAIHEDVYQVLVNELTEVYARSGYKYLTFEDVLNKEVKRYKEWEKECLTEIDKYKTFLPEEMDDKEKSAKALMLIKNMKQFGEQYERTYSYNSQNDLNKMISMLEEYPIENQKSIIKKIAEYKHFAKKMEDHNLMFRPTMSSGQEYDFSGDAVFLNKVANAVASLTSGADEEYMPMKQCSKMWQEINYSDMELYFIDGWGKDPKENEYWTPLQNFKEKHKEMKKVLLTPEEFLKKSEYEFIKEFLLNKELDIHISMDI